MSKNWRIPLAVGALMAAAPALANPIILQTVIPIPVTAANKQPGGAFTSFDISFYNPANDSYYLADRSNGSVDIISGATRTVVGQATGFTGQGATTSVSGADGVVVVSAGGVTTLYAGDGNSTLKVFNVTNPAAPSLLQTISTGGSFRVDEMAYSPLTKQVLTANNADAPAFSTLYNTTNGTSPVSIGVNNIKVPGAANGDGLEQPLWHPGTGTFFVTVPVIAGAGSGGLVQISTAGAVLNTYNFATQGIASCSPTGLAVGASGNLLVGCGNKNTQTLLVNPTTGAIIKSFTSISGTDEIWYDPASGNFYVTGSDASGNRVFTLISDATQLVTQTVNLPVSSLANPHSITVNSLNGDIYVPLAGNTATVGGNTACALGCIAVFNQQIPEPAPLPMLLFGALALAGVAGHRRWVSDRT